MAFQNKNLSVLAYANGFTLWHYTTEDKLDEIISGYFNPVSDLMSKNDMIILNAGDQNCILFVKELVGSCIKKEVKLG